MIEEIKHNDEILAIIVSNNYHYEGIKFFTPDSFSQQLGYMNRPKGYIIEPHLHLPVKRKVTYTNEVLFIKSGKVKVNFYTNDKFFINKRILITGDVILLIKGGHGFEMLENSEIIEVKQGPYVNENDKERFKPKS